MLSLWNHLFLCLFISPNFPQESLSETQQFFGQTKGKAVSVTSNHTHRLLQLIYRYRISYLKFSSYRSDTGVSGRGQGCRLSSAPTERSICYKTFSGSETKNNSARSKRQWNTPQPYPKREEDKRHPCPPLETPESYEENLK